MAAAESPARTARPSRWAGSRLAARLSKTRLSLMIGAIGVVYGDIGTSPLYAFNLLFPPAVRPHLSSDAVIGGLSLIIWALTLIVALKYAVLVLFADNDGEGGVLSLIHI